MDIDLVPANESDVEDLVKLRIAAMRDSLERMGRFDPQRARDRFLSTFSPAHTRHICINGTRIGFVVVKTGADGLLLDHLYITPEHQNNGIGSRILRMIFEEADRKGLPLRVGALKKSDSNRFYIRHGFDLVEESEWDNHYVRHARNT